MSFARVVAPLMAGAVMSSALFFQAAAQTPGNQPGTGPGMMHDHWMGWWGGPLHGLGALLLVLLIIVVMVALMRAIGDKSGRDRKRVSALEALDARYARGEIGREEYLEKKKDIADRSPGNPRKFP